MYDTRAFTAIHTDTVTCLVCRQRDAGVGVWTVAARSGLSRELVNFLGQDLKAVFFSIYGVIGALTMLVVYDGQLLRRPGQSGDSEPEAVADDAGEDSPA
jgi:hypothetical protein